MAENPTFLNVQILSAAALPDKSLFGSQDVYFSCSIGSLALKTRVLQGGDTSPVLQGGAGYLSFPLEGQARPLDLELQAHAIAKWKGDQLLGSIVLPASYVQALPLDGEVRDDSLSLTLGKAACGSIYVRLSRATKPLELPNETYTPAAAGGGCLRGCLSCCSCCDEPGNDYLNYATSSCMAFCLGACCMASS